MSPTASVQSVQLLEDAKIGLSKFQDAVSDALQAAKNEAQATLEWLAERCNHWQREVARRQQEVNQAAAALARCQASGYTDREGRYHPPNCNAQEQALSLARRELQKAEGELANARRWQGQVQQAFNSFNVEAARTERLRSTHIEQAKAFLAQKLSDLQSYLAAVIGVSVIGPAFVRSIQAQCRSLRIQVGQYAVNQAKQQEIQLVQQTGRGTRNWSARQLDQLKRDQFPKGFAGHHINNVARFPDLAGNPDNITFVTFKQHLAAHHGSWRNNTSGKMFNRKSLMVQWVK